MVGPMKYTAGEISRLSHPFASTLSAHLCVTLLQWLLALLMVFSQGPTHSMRQAFFLIPVLTAAAPVGLLVTHFARQEWDFRIRVVGTWWSATLSAFFLLSVVSAYDGSGPELAKALTETRLGLVCTCSMGLLIGVQGALLDLSAETRAHVAAIIFISTLIKVHHCEAFTYRLVQLGVVLPLALGYVWTRRWTTLAAACKAAHVVIRSARAVREPFLVADEDMRILAVNARFTELLGYTVGEVVGRPVTMLMADAVDIQSHDQWVKLIADDCGYSSPAKRSYLWSVLCKAGARLPVRIVVGETRCALNGTRFFTAILSSVALEHRNAQLVAEKERLEWEVKSHSGLGSSAHHGDADDPREALGATQPTTIDGCQVANDRRHHRTLGALQDQVVTDAAVSCAHSYDHVESNETSPPRIDSPIASPPPSSPCSIRGSGRLSETASLVSSVMDTKSVAASKDITRAPPPPKSPGMRQRLFGSGSCSEPAPETRSRRRELAVRLTRRAQWTDMQVERDPREHS